MKSLKDPLLHAEVGEDDVAYAAWIIEDAMYGQHAEDYPYGEGAKSIRKRCSRTYYTNYAYEWALLSILFMMLFESPLWCQNSQFQKTFLSSAERCPLPDGSTPIMSGLPILPPLYGMCLEAFFMLIMTFALFYEKGLYSMAPQIRWPNAHPEWFLGIMCLMWVDLAWFAYDQERRFRFAPYGRLLLTMSFESTRQVFQAAINCLDEFGNLALYVFGTILFFAWVLIMILDDVRDRMDADVSLTELAGQPFGSFPSTLMSLFQMQTGANYPDFMIPLWIKGHWSVFIFYPFMIITFFLFTQVMLAIIYNAYQDNIKVNLKNFYVNRLKGLSKVFQVLASNGANGPAISGETFDDLLRHLASFPRLSATVKEDFGMVLFAVLDDDGGGELGLDEWMDICDYLQFTFWTAPVKSRFRKAGFELSFVNSMIETHRLDFYVDSLMIMNFFFIIYSSYLDMNQLPEPSYFSIVQLVFSFIYIVDILMRLYYTSFWNFFIGERKFDFVVSWLLMFAGIASFVPSLTRDVTDILPYLQILRVCRLFKLLFEIEAFRSMSNTIFELISCSRDMMVLLVITTMGFVVVGQQIYGGLLYSHNPLLKGSDLLDSSYEVYNFNDCAVSFMTLFNMMVEGFMPEYSDALGRVAPGGHYFVGPLYCGLFYFIGVNISFNIFTAFTIDIFVSLKEGHDNPTTEQSEEDRNLEKMHERMAEEGLNLHMSIPGEVLKARAIVSVIGDLDDIINAAKKEARDLADEKLAGKPSPGGTTYDTKTRKMKTLEASIKTMVKELVEQAKDLQKEVKENGNFVANEPSRG